MAAGIGAGFATYTCLTLRKSFPLSVSPAQPEMGPIVITTQRHRW